MCIYGTHNQAIYIDEYIHRNIKIQGITTVISLLYEAHWNHYFVSPWISMSMRS